MKKRLVGLPRYALDGVVVEPPKKQKKTPEEEKAEQRERAIAKCAPEYRGPCCEGFRWWGLGDLTLVPATRLLRQDNFNQPLPSELKRQKKLYLCGVSGCRRALQPLNEAEMAKKKAWWAELQEKHGLDGARVVAALASAVDEDQEFWEED